MLEFMLGLCEQKNPLRQLKWESQLSLVLEILYNTKYIIIMQLFHELYYTPQSSPFYLIVLVDSHLCNTLCFHFSCISSFCSNLSVIFSLPPSLSGMKKWMENGRLLRCQILHVQPLLAVVNGSRPWSTILSIRANGKLLS